MDTTEILNTGVKVIMFINLLLLFVHFCIPFLYLTASIFGFFQNSDEEELASEEKTATSSPKQLRMTIPEVEQYIGDDITDIWNQVYPNESQKNELNKAKMASAFMIKYEKMTPEEVWHYASNMLQEKQKREMNVGLAA